MVMLAASAQLGYPAVIDVLERLPATVAARQDELGLTTKVLAKQIGITTATAYRFLDGAGKPTLATVLAVLRWLAAH